MGCKPKCGHTITKRKTQVKKRTDWKRLKNPKMLGYVCNLWSSTKSELPIRRFEKFPNGSKLEPHYEDLTYGENACCNRNGRNICVSENRKYIFFVTRYYGKLQNHRDNEYKYSIVGYYSLKDFKDVCGELDSCNGTLEKRKIPCKKWYKNCFAVRAEDIKFTTIEESFPLYSEKGKTLHKNLELLFGKHAREDGGDSKDWIYNHKIENARHLKGRIGYRVTKKLLEHFKEKSNKTDEYIREIKSYKQKK